MNKYFKQDILNMQKSVEKNLTLKLLNKENSISENWKYKDKRKLLQIKLG